MIAAFATQIEIDSSGVAWISGTTVKVLEVVLDKLTHGWSPEEIHFQHPHLSMAQIHAALTYYYEHQVECDQAIQCRLREAEALAVAVEDAALRARIQAAATTP